MDNAYGNSTAAGEIKLSVGKSLYNPVKGNVEFNNLEVSSSTQSVLNARIPMTSFHTTFNNSKFLNVAKDGESKPLLIQTTSYSGSVTSFGNLTFNSTQISYNTTQPFIAMYGSF